MPAATLPAPTAPPFADPRLHAIRDKALAGERLTLDDGDLLYTTRDIWTVCELADTVRRRLHGDAAYYNVNRHFNYSNVCALSCKFCDFYAKRGDAHAYTRSLDDARAEARRAVDAGATEIHIVGGLDPYLPWDYYPDLLRAIRDEAPTLHIKAFTAVEIVHLARIAKVYKQADRRAGIRWVLELLIDAGLGSLPGGGAEVFDDRVHDEAFKGKIRSDVWLDVHRTAHELGLNTNATILYGHVEDRHERLVHMDMLRCAQDEALARMGYERIKPSSHQGAGGAITLTRPGVPLPQPDRRLSTHRSPDPSPCGYFQTIIPLPFFPDGSELQHLPGPSGLENLRTLAVARLMLDNFPHVKAFWIMQTLPMAQLMLQCGADDIDGTVVWYDITKVGGATTHQEVDVWTLQKAIREAGFTPIERDTLYRRVEREAQHAQSRGL
ncbi:MAG: aminodeoxyfutalosine synthase [Phycisphaerales bacterium]|nr:radical SAM protein [Phycisphaerales bacterium]GIK20448.1 MAG: aminodeoxyfutalosine synthase [Planctomycetota bacterium]